MIFLIILGIILLIILSVLFIPVVVDLEYNDDFDFKIIFLKFTLFKSKPEPEIKELENIPKVTEKKKKSSVLNDAKDYFNQIKEKEGFTGAVKAVMGLVSQLFSHIKWLFKFIKIRKVKLNVTVGTIDAAKTALDYGIVCNAIYPVTAFLDSVAHVGFKEINVNADFEGGKCNFGFSGTVKMQIFYLLICAFKIYKTLKKFVTENEI